MKNNIIPKTDHLIGLQKETTEIIDTALASINKIATDTMQRINVRREDIQTEIGELVAGLTKTTEEWKRLQDDVAKLEARKTELIEHEAMLAEKEQQVAVDEAKLLELHQALNNKRQVLEQREKKLEEKEHGSRE